MRSTRRLPALTAAALAVLAAYPVVASATWAGKPGKISYYALTEDDSAIFTVRPNGTRNRRLSKADGDMAWSRGGKKIAFFRGTDDLWQARADGSKARRILGHIPGDGSMSDVAWAPNARRLAFTVTFEDESVDDEGELVVTEREYVYTVRRDGKKLRRLRRGHDPAWSPRGFIAYAQEDGDIATMRPNGRGRRIWVPQGSPVFTHGLDVSPDGNKLVYFQSTPDITKQTIRTFNFRTRRRTRFREGTEQVNALDVVWTPAGGRLAYLHSPRGGNGSPAPPDEVRTIRPSGKKRKTLFKLPQDHTAFDFAWQTR